jgi:hypothetical protein
VLSVGLTKIEGSYLFLGTKALAAVGKLCHTHRPEKWNHVLRILDVWNILSFIIEYKKLIHNYKTNIMDCHVYGNNVKTTARFYGLNKHEEPGG